MCKEKSEKEIDNRGLICCSDLLPPAGSDYWTHVVVDDERSKKMCKEKYEELLEAAKLVSHRTTRGRYDSDDHIWTYDIMGGIRSPMLRLLDAIKDCMPDEPQETG